MKTLSREGIQRMVDGAGGSSVSGGGISSGDLAGLATQVWVNQNYLSIDFFSSLFKAYGPAETEGDPDVEIVPNDTESTISNIKAMFGFWTEQYISALGQGSGGGGGGATALVDLVDVAISNPTNGQVLKYNSTTGKWYNGTDEGVTSLAWSQITDKPTTLTGYGITDAYTKTEADAKYLTSSSFSAFTASSLNISATIGTTTRTVQAPTIAYLGNNDEAASSEITPSSKFVGTKFGASSGFYMTGVYPSESSPADIPCNYGNILNILGGGGGQLLAEWCNTYKTGHLYYRSHRDYLATGGWTPWEKIAFISDFSSWALASTKPSYSFSELTSHPTTLSGYGITDAYISSGTIYLGGNSITPLTSFTETDPTVPAWAKAASKPSYSFSELTGTVAFSQLPTMFWADVAVSYSSNNNTSPQFGNLRLRPGSNYYGSYLRFGDGDYAYLAELSDDHLTYRAVSHTFNVSSNEAVQINSSGLRIGGSSGVVLSWDSTNNALKVQKADGTAANLYATGGVSALGMSGGSGGSIGNLRVTGTLNIGSSYASLYCNSNNYLYVDAPRIYFNSTLYTGSNNIRTESGDIYTEEGNIYLGGGRLYLDSSRYIYLDGSTLKFYDGSTAKTIYTY